MVLQGSSLSRILHFRVILHFRGLIQKEAKDQPRLREEEYSGQGSTLVYTSSLYHPVHAPPWVHQGRVQYTRQGTVPER